MLNGLIVLNTKSLLWHDGCCYYCKEVLYVWLVSVLCVYAFLGLLLFSFHCGDYTSLYLSFSYTILTNG